MHRIQTTCLGHKEKFTDNFQTVEQLKLKILEKYKKYLVHTNAKETYVPFILAYKHEATGREEILTNINAIPTHGKKWFRLYVKRVCKKLNA